MTFSSGITWAVGPTMEVSTVGQHADRLEDRVELGHHALDLGIGQAKAGKDRHVLDVGSRDHAPMLAGYDSAADVRATRDSPGPIRPR